MKQQSVLLCAILLPFLLFAVSCNTALSKDRLLNIIPEDTQALDVTHFIYTEERNFTISAETLDALKEWLASLEVHQKKEFKDGEYPGQIMSGGEAYDFKMPDGTLLFSFQDFGSKERYLILEDEWYLLQNAPSPPVSECEDSESPARVVR